LLFELVSAFGVVGLSLGQPGTNYSYSGSFSVLSKLIVMLVMFAGRHRGIPLLFDSAIQVMLRPFRKTHIHMMPIADSGKYFQTRESTSNLGQNYTLEGEAIPAHFRRPIHPLVGTPSSDAVAVVAPIIHKKGFEMGGAVEIGRGADL
jgi:hypothetical protein